MTEWSYVGSALVSYTYLSLQRCESFCFKWHEDNWAREPQQSCQQFCKIHIWSRFWPRWFLWWLPFLFTISRLWHVSFYYECVLEDSCLSGWGAVSSAMQFLTLRIDIFSSSGSSSPNKILLSPCTEALWLFEVFGTAYPVTHLHNPEDMDILQHCYENGWFQASAMKHLRTAPFWVIMLCVVVISYYNLLCNNPAEWSSHLLWEHQISQCIRVILITLPKFGNTVMHRLTTGICSEKCVIRQFRCHSNVIEFTCTNLNGIAHYTPRLYGTAYCS